MTSKPSAASDSGAAMGAAAPKSPRGANTSDSSVPKSPRSLNDSASSGTVLQRSGLQHSSGTFAGEVTRAAVEEEGGTLAGWKFDDNMLKTYDVKTSVRGCNSCAFAMR